MKMVKLIVVLCTMVTVMSLSANVKAYTIEVGVGMQPTSTWSLTYRDWALPYEAVSANDPVDGWIGGYLGAEYVADDPSYVERDVVIFWEDGTSSSAGWGIPGNGWGAPAGGGFGAYFYWTANSSSLADMALAADEVWSFITAVGFQFREYDFTSSNWNYSETSTIAIVSQPPIVPEPISSTLFLVGAVTLGFRRLRKKTKKM